MSGTLTVTTPDAQTMQVAWQPAPGAQLVVQHREAGATAWETTDYSGSSVTIAGCTPGSACDVRLVQVIATGSVTMPPALPPTKDGTWVSKVGDPAIVDDTGNSYTLVDGSSLGRGVMIAKNGTRDSVTQQVVQLGILSRKVFQANSSSNWYTDAATGKTTTTNWQQVADPTKPAPPPPPPGSNYKVSNGRILDPSGAVWTAKGIAVLDSCINQASPATLQKWFPRLNAVRLAVGGDGAGFASAQPTSALVNWINAATAAGLVILVDNHTTGQVQASSINLANEYAWVNGMAKQLANNPRVMWESGNELGPTGMPQEHQNTYKAVRDAGSGQIVVMCVPYGNPQLPPDASIYKPMSNIAWDQHSYAWMYQGTTNQATAASGLTANLRALQAFAQSADGTIPVICAEYGNGSGSNQPDGVAGGCNVAAVQQVMPGYAGQFAWLLWWPGAPNPPGVWPADDLVNQYTGAVTAYGASVAGAM